MRSTFADRLFLLFTLGVPALCQLTSNPSQPNFLRRAFHRSTIRSNFLYIDGGELNQIDNSSGTPEPFTSTQNTTLSIDLRSSWTNSSVAFNSIGKLGSILNEEWLWNDPDGQTFYLWGGYTSQLVERDEPGSTVWAFVADGQGSGAWLDLGNASSTLVRTSGALVASSDDGIGYAIGGNGPDGAVPGMVTYNMSAQTWGNNESTTALSSKGTAMAGQLISTNVFGENGILIALDGSDGTTGQVASLNDFSSVKIYDRQSGSWYKQATVGTPPEARAEFCAVAAHGESSMEIFIHGGFGGSKTLAYDDVYVLSLPSFTWYKADYTPGVGRTLHTCNAIDRNMIVVGGTSNVASWKTGNASGIAPYRDPWPAGLGVFDMTTMQWASEFNPNLGPYTTPDMVAAGISEHGREPSSWSSPEIQTVFSFTKLTHPNITPPHAKNSSSSGIGDGAIAGIAVGAVAAIGVLVGALFALRRSKRRSRAGHNPYPTNINSYSNINSYPMNMNPNDREVAKGSPTQMPLIEIDGRQRPEKSPSRFRDVAELEQGIPNLSLGGMQSHDSTARNGQEQWRHELP